MLALRHLPDTARLLRAIAAALLCGALLAGCASKAPAPVAPTAQLLHDALYPDAGAVPPADAVFALSDGMRRYAEHDLRGGRLPGDPRRSLLEALYNRRELRLLYDAGSTRNASEAFEQRAGNCLSLVIMTAAFAKHLGLPVSYRQVLVDESYTRSAGLMMANGHVNLVLERLPARSYVASAADDLIVDFLPAAEIRGQRSLPLEERTILAMYYNNLAAEALADGHHSRSYAFARAAVLADPGYGAAANTLAVVYLRDGHHAEAEAALRHVLKAEPESVAALGNLKIVLQRAGRTAEAEAVGARLLALQPFPPFHFFELGRQAMDMGDFEAARHFFARELKRQPYQHEVHFWAAQAHWRLGEERRAAEHLRLAMENSLTPGGQQRYAAKLEHLREQRGRRLQ
jgi:tetratricopeptide (TPR) repeat protein